MTAHQDVAGVADVERQIREMGFDAAMANNLAEIVRISAQAGKDESAAEIARLSKALSEAEAEADKYCEWWREKRNECIAAESRLAEAMKVIEPFAAMPGCYEMHEDDVIYKNAGAALTAGDFRAARRFLNAGKE